MTNLKDCSNGDIFEGPLLIKKQELKLTKNGDEYIRLYIGDKNIELMANLWGMNHSEKDKYPSGVVRYFKIKVGEYEGKPQVNQIISMHQLREDDERNDVGLYLKTPPISTEKMREMVKEKIDAIDNEDVKIIVRDIMNKYHKKFFTHGAAKGVHHAFTGGLSFHTVSMLKRAETCVEFDGLRPWLMYGAILIHDICKIEEMDDVLNGAEYTFKGQALGHIVMASEEVTRAALNNDIAPDSEHIILLKNAVLSHHGKLEWGSPVNPITPEGWAIHGIDSLDADIQKTKEALENVEPGTFSERVWALDKTSIYKSSDQA